MAQDILGPVKDETRKLTYGERMVGINFNPSGHPAVDTAKENCAELIDLLRQDMEHRENSVMGLEIHKMAEYAILQAQMMVVKALTFKD